MDLIQLKRFLAAAEFGSLRQAAATLHVSQPALTQSIKSLERALGVELFERGTRGVELTQFGRLLIPRARMLLNERDRILRDLDDARTGESLRVSVGVGPYFSRQLFPAAALRVAQKHPKLVVDIVEGHSLDLLSQLREGSIEFAFCVLNPAAAADTSLEFEDTYVEQYSVMARVGHPIFRKKRAGDRDLSSCSWIVYDRHNTAGFVTRHFESRGLPAPRTPFIARSLPLMVALMIKSDVVALMPEDFVWPEVAASRLRRVTGHSIHVDGRGGILTRKGAVPGVLAQALIGELRAVCADARQATGRAGAAIRGANQR
jgi:DNA-binding transcriptional LysR family regulator